MTMENLPKGVIFTKHWISSWKYKLNWTVSYTPNLKKGDPIDGGNNIVNSLLNEKKWNLGF